MLGYALFIIPMAIAFVWVSATRNVKQALLDLIAFNLLFEFDFSALLPNNTNLLLIHVLIIAFVGLSIVELIILRRLRATQWTILVFVAIFIFFFWLSTAIFINKIPLWGFTRTSNYLVRGYLLNALFIFAGISLAEKDKLERFGKIFIITCVLVGIISILQTVSNGHLLTSDNGDNYLQIFQPLGDKAIARRDRTEAVLSYLDIVRTIRFGDLSFYRAAGTFDGVYVNLCIAALLSLCLLTATEKKVSRWLFVPLFLSFAAIVAAFNRTAIVTFCVLGALIFLMRFRALLSLRVLRRWLVPIALMAVIALALAPMFSSVIAANLDGFFGSRGNREVGSLNGRSSLWSYVVSEIKRSPIVGSDRPITLYRAGWGASDNPDIDVSTHNSFLEFAYRGGVVPGFLFLALFAFCVLRAWQLSRSQALTTHDRFMFFMLLVAIAALGLLNLTASMIIVPQVMALFWILCGYLSAYRQPLNIRSVSRSTLGDNLTPQPVG